MYTRVGGETNKQAGRTNLGQLHELLGGRHHTLWFHLIDEAVGDVGVAVIEQLADDQLVQLLAVLQRWFLAIHVEQEQPGTNTLTTALNRQCFNVNWHVSVFLFIVYCNNPTFGDLLVSYSLVTLQETINNCVKNEWKQTVGNEWSLAAMLHSLAS